MACTQTYFADFPVTLVDQQPATDDYLLAVVGGNMTLFKMIAWGEADTGSDGIYEGGTAFVFSDDHQTDHRAQRICETLAHEIGHMLGLDHVDACQDLMSANASCVWDGPRPGFLDENRAKLVKHLMRFGKLATKMLPESRQINAYSDGSKYWSLVVDARKPVVHAKTYKIAPDGTRSESPCQGNGCSVVGRQLSSILHVPTSGTWQLQFDVLYADGTSARSDWFSTQVQ
jgi:hypothetical protein